MYLQVSKIGCGFWWVWVVNFEDTWRINLSKDVVWFVRPSTKKRGSCHSGCHFFIIVRDSSVIFKRPRKVVVPNCSVSRHKTGRRQKKNVTIFPSKLYAQRRVLWHPQSSFLHASLSGGWGGGVPQIDPTVQLYLLTSTMCVYADKKFTQQKIS